MVRTVPGTHWNKTGTTFTSVVHIINEIVLSKNTRLFTTFRFFQFFRIIDTIVDLTSVGKVVTGFINEATDLALVFPLITIIHFIVDRVVVAVVGHRLNTHFIAVKDKAIDVRGLWINGNVRIAWRIRTFPNTAIFIIIVFQEGFRLSIVVVNVFIRGVDFTRGKNTAIEDKGIPILLLLIIIIIILILIIIIFLSFYILFQIIPTNIY